MLQGHLTRSGSMTEHKGQKRWVWWRKEGCRNGSKIEYIEAQRKKTTLLYTHITGTVGNKLGFSLYLGRKIVPRLRSLITTLYFDCVPEFQSVAQWIGRMLTICSPMCLNFCSCFQLKWFAGLKPKNSDSPAKSSYVTMLFHNCIQFLFFYFFCISRFQGWEKRNQVSQCDKSHPRSNKLESKNESMINKTNILCCAKL